MADGNHLKIADQVDLADDDPFAELTRIMGFDPRQPAKPAAPEKSGSAQPSVQQAAVPEAAAPQKPASVAAPVEDVADEDDFSMDLERELMGQFSAEDDELVASQDDDIVAALAEDLAEAEPAAAAANEPEAHDIDFDLAQDFDAAMAASAGEVELDLDLTPTESHAEEASQPAMAAEPVLAEDDDKDIAAEFDAAMADINMDFAPDASVVETPVLDAGDDKQTVQVSQEDTVQASGEDSGDVELRLPKEDEIQLDADEFHIDEEEFRIDESELELDAGHPVEASEPQAEECELSFDGVDFAGELDAIADEAAADKATAIDDAAVDLEEPEETALELTADEAEPVMRYEPLEARRHEMVEAVRSPMDIAAAAYRGREPEVAETYDFNLEDELNALLGNNKPVEPGPVEAAPSNESVLLHESAPLHDTEFLNETAPLNDWHTDTFTGAKRLEEPFDDMDWDLDDKVEAAPEPVEDDQPEVYADEEQPEAYYAEDDQPGLYAEDNRPEVHAQDLDSEDSEMSAPLGVDDGYRDTAYAAPASEAPPFDVEAFVAETTRRLDAVRAAPEPYKYRSADTAASDPAWSSPHRDPVVRGDPMKEDPLDVITALAAKYSKPLPPASYGRANVAPPAPPAPMPPKQLAEVEDDSGDEIDYRAAFDDDAPDVETVEVADRAVAIADDLDIPDLALDDDLPPVSAYDDLDAEFASLLNDMNGAEPVQSRSSGYDDDFADDSKAPARPYQAETKTAPVTARHASTIPGYDDEADQYAFDVDDLPGSRSLEGAQYGPDEFDYDPGFDEAVPGPAMAVAASRPKPQRRGMLVAAIVGGVAIVGGLGAFALSFGDDSGDTPAIVMADDGPVKVKPENPGGTTVPNQDSKVYDTVAGQGSAGEPQQEKLVTTAEEPIDMTPPAAPAGEDMAAGSLPKGEDRIEQILQEAENQTDTEIAAVAPRKVRTMVVKPDGTLVPRDEPEATQAASPAETEPVAPAQDMTLATPAQDLAIPAPAPEATGALPAMAPEIEQILTPPTGEAPVAAETPATPEPPVAAEPPPPAPEMQAAVPAPEMQTTEEPTGETQESANTPETAPIAPLRPADQPIDVVGEVKADQVASAATAAAGSSWSMQIASQPSEAAAQSSYQDLARRYGSVLEGREVNIVKAEIAGKGTFWRVRVPAKSRNDAISLCENYKASGGNCFVSR